MPSYAHSLAAGDVGEAEAEAVDDVVPGVAGGGGATFAAEGGGEIGMGSEEVEAGGQLLSVGGLDGDPVLEGADVVLAGGAGDRDPFAGHDLEADQAERLAAGVGEDGVRGAIEGAEELLRDKEADVEDVRVGGAGEGAEGGLAG